MTLTPVSPPVVADDPPVVADDFQDMFKLEEEPLSAQALEPGLATESKRLAPARQPRGRGRGLLILITFVMGALLGWLVIGWWIWPVEWNNSALWQLQPRYQKSYVHMVADQYYLTSNVSEVEQALAGWNRDDLNTLIAAMQKETIDPEARSRLAALAEVLKLPGVESSLIGSLFSQSGLIVGLILAALPLLAAIGLVVSPALRRKGRSIETTPAGADEAHGDLEELLADAQMAEQPLEEQEQQQQQAADEKKKEDEEQEAKSEEEKEEKGSSDQPDSSLGDLASLFEEEDTSIASLEAFCKGMPDVEIEQLVKNAAEIVTRFKQSSPVRTAKTGSG